MTTTPDEANTGTAILVVGDGELTATVVRELQRTGARTRWLHDPSDREFSAALREQPDSVAVVTRDDARALRLALLSAHERPEAKLMVTIFDRTVAEQLRAAVEGCVVVSMADLVASSLAGSCLNEGVAAILRTRSGLQRVAFPDDQPRLSPHRERSRTRVHHALDRVIGATRPYDLSGRILMWGLVGLAAMLCIEVAIGLAALHESFVSALFLGVRTLVAVGPDQALTRASDGVRLLAVATMVATLALTAVFTAGLVNRLLDTRRVGILGQARDARRDHVIVVGMGQVGLRLALLLREAGVPVVGVDRHPDAMGVRLAKRYGLPVILAPGGDRELLERLSPNRARCLAAVTSDDLTNIEVALAGRAVSPGLPIVLRAGDGEIAAETRSLLYLGTVCDAHLLAGIGLAAASLGWEPGHVVLDPHNRALLIDDDDRIAPFPPRAGH